METFKQHPLLLTFLAVLVVLRFILVPVLEWQDSKIATINQLEKRVSKAERAIKTKEFNEQGLTDLLPYQKQVNELFYPTEPENTFKLARQQWLETLLAKHQVQSVNLGWQGSGEVKDLPLLKHKLELQFNANMVDFPAFQLALQDNPQLLEIDSLMLTLKGQRKEKLGRISGKMTMLFYQQLSADSQKKSISGAGE